MIVVRRRRSEAKHCERRRGAVYLQPAANGLETQNIASTKAGKVLTDLLIDVVDDRLSWLIERERDCDEWLKVKAQLQGQATDCDVTRGRQSHRAINRDIQNLQQITRTHI